ncbi:MAG: hypothetical protein J0H68_09035 [Sphingobacteriia bacterium]|nr:hypothetical protein [Sphingobacteriia bacterium]
MARKTYSLNSEKILISSLGYFKEKVTFGAELEFYSLKPLELENLNLFLRSFDKNIKVVKEDGENQFEIIFPPFNDALNLANLIDKVKNNLTDITFSAKPFINQPSSGLHFNFSFPNKDFFENNFKYIIQGLIKYLKESLVYFCPSDNDYTRFTNKADLHSPKNISWGFNNRSTAIRVPPPNENCDVKRIEHRISSPNANPYLAISVILYAAKFGIDEQLLPPEPTYGIASNEQYFKEVLPQTYLEALNYNINSKIQWHMLMSL